MAPKEPFKVHSLSKHIEDTKKGLSAEAQYNRRPGIRSSIIQQEPGVPKSNIFGNNDDSDDSSDSSDSDSDEETGADLLKKITASGAMTSAATKRRSKDDEIADSDVERKTSANKAPGAKQESNIKGEDSSSDSDDSSSESESDESEPKVKTNGASADANTTSTSDTSSSGSDASESESEEDSSDDEGDATNPTIAERAAATKMPVAKSAANGTTKTAESSSSSTSSSGDSDEESSEAENIPEPSKPPPKQTKPTVESSSSEEESDEEDEMADESMHFTDRQNGNQIATPNFITSDFILRKGDDGANGNDVARICNEANLQGKQFWYFTVPSNVPISVVQNLEIPIEGAQIGDRVFSHDGHDYGVSFDSAAPKSSIQILIPSSNGQSYKPSTQQVDQTMHIKRITSLGNASSTTAGPAPRSAPRPQPKGLKVRYQPFGVNTPMGNIGGDASEDGEDVEMAEAQASSEKPEKKDKIKRKNGVSEPGAAAPKTPTADRKGKRKHTASEDDAVAVAEQLRAETKSVDNKSKKVKTARGGSPDLGSETPSARKVTHIAPPTIPQSSYTFAGLGHSAPVTSTPPPKASTPEARTKKSSKKVKIQNPVSSSEVASSTGKKETPVPVPRQTAVPLPNIPLTSRPKESPVPIPSANSIATTSKAKKSKKVKDERVLANSSQTSPPPSAQAAAKTKSTVKTKNLG